MDRPGNWSECASRFLAVKPNKGDAILFHSMKPNGELEERSMHGACPVISGEKWSMTKWWAARWLPGPTPAWRRRGWGRRQRPPPAGCPQVKHAPPGAAPLPPLPRPPPAAPRNPPRRYHAMHYNMGDVYDERYNKYVQDMEELRNSVGRPHSEI
jgi:hypothetical protein